MPRFRREAVRVVVPASSANLGTAFDCGGLALDVCDEYVAMVSDDAGVLIEVSGEGASDVPLDATHLVARSMALSFAAMDVQPPGFVLRCENRIPHGRGMGSSAAAIIGGLVLGRAMVIDGPAVLTDDDLLQLALRMESHPDNIAAALYGGLNFSWLAEAGSAGTVKLDVHPEIVPVLAIPGDAVPTSKARTALPAQVDFADASFNIARAALLVHALTRDPGHLLEATRDRMHQEARRTMYSASLELVERLRAESIPAVISGAGPTVLALPRPMDAERLQALADPTWRIVECAVAHAGAREVPIDPTHL
jgi:homoserine kinase